MAGVNPIEARNGDEVVPFGLAQIDRLVTRLVGTENCRGGGVVLSGVANECGEVAMMRAWRGSLEAGAGLIQVMTRAGTVYCVEAERDGRHRVSVNGMVESDENKAWLGKQLSVFFGRADLEVMKIDESGQEVKSGGRFEWRPVVVAEMPVVRNHPTTSERSLPMVDGRTGERADVEYVALVRDTLAAWNTQIKGVIGHAVFGDDGEKGVIRCYWKEEGRLGVEVMGGDGTIHICTLVVDGNTVRGVDVEGEDVKSVELSLIVGKLRQVVDTGTLCHYAGNVATETIAVSFGGKVANSDVVLVRAVESRLGASGGGNMSGRITLEDGSVVEAKLVAMMGGVGMELKFGGDVYCVYVRDGILSVQNEYERSLAGGREGEELRVRVLNWVREIVNRQS
ncbi:MAG: hypothetical protein WCV93_02045 [Candidatus Shapirobacteria bacterium]|jgi:hypothetical protein